MMKFIYFIFLLLISCTYPLYPALLASSDSITESKRRDVFLSHYRADSNLIVLNKNIVFDDIWIDKCWVTGRFIWKTKPCDPKRDKQRYQLIIKTKNCQLQGYGHDWNIGNGFTNSFRLKGTDYCCLIVSLDSLPKSDTITYSIKRGEASKTNKDIIGELSLIKVLK